MEYEPTVEAPRRTGPIRKTLGSSNSDYPVRLTVKFNRQGEMETDIKLRKFGIIDLLRTGLKVYAGNFKNIALVILCVFLPTNILVYSITFTFPLLLSEKLNHEYPPVYLFLDWSLDLIVFLANLLATLGVAAIIGASIDGQCLEWKNGLRIAFAHWGQAILTGLLRGLIVFGMTLLLILPGVMVSVDYSFWIFVVALRGRSGKEALDYSRDLVKGQWFRVLGFQIAQALPIGLVLFIIFIAIRSIPLGLISSILFFTMLELVASFYTVTNLLFFLNIDYAYHPQPEMKIPSMNSL